MTTDKKLYIALGVLVILGGAAYLQQQKQAAEIAAHSYDVQSAELPKIALGDEDVEKVDKIEITKPAESAGDAGSDGTGSREKVVLEKKGEEDWALVEPVAYKANASNVKSLLDNLKRLDVREQIDPSKEAYAKFGVSDDKALHAVFYKGGEAVLDLYFGEDGSRGQMTRVAGRDGVYAVKGYSGYLFKRDVAAWRDKTIFKLEENDVESIRIENENGTFAFKKEGEEWKGEHKKPKAFAAGAIPGFDPGKVGDLLRAYKSLNASKFGDDKSPADVGLEEPAATVTLELKGGTGKHVLKVGDATDDSGRWVMRNGSDQIFTISSWSADWATADASRFAKSDDDDEATAAAPEPPPMQMQMPQIPGH